jgi:hypothetical protein
MKRSLWSRCRESASFLPRWQPPLEELRRRLQWQLMVEELRRRLQRQLMVEELRHLLGRRLLVQERRHLLGRRLVVQERQHLLGGRLVVQGRRHLLGRRPPLRGPLTEVPALLRHHPSLNPMRGVLPPPTRLSPLRPRGTPTIRLTSVLPDSR